MAKKSVKINNRQLSLSNLEKEFYPGYGFSKARVLEYYTLIAPYILPHLKGRAATLKRYPDGAMKEFFFEKRCPAYRPDWIETADVPYGGTKRLTACLINNLQSLIWVQNLASIELHVPLASAKTPGIPDSVVFDLDPGGGAGALECARVALLLKEMFTALKLDCFVKTSGKKGLHVYVPLNSGSAGYGDTKAFSKAAAMMLERKYPALVTSKMAKPERAKKVFINWSQNDASKTMACVYTLRAGDKPCVSAPLEWKEVAAFEKKGDVSGFVITHRDAVKRALKKGDIFGPVLTKKQRLPVL